MPLFGSVEVELWKLYNALNDGAPWPWSYWDQPAVFAQASQIIRTEAAAVQREASDG